MIPLRTSRRAFDEAGALNTLFSAWGFAAEDTLLFKNGDIGAVFTLQGIDAEGCDPAQRDRIVAHVYASMKVFDHRYHWYQYLVRRRRPPLEVPACSLPIAAQAIARQTAHLNRRTLYETDLYVVVLLTALQPRQAIFPTRRDPVALLASDLAQSLGQLNDALTTLTEMWGELTPTRLDRAGIFHFLETLASYSGEHRGTPPETHLDCHVSHVMPTRYPDHLEIGAHYVKVLTLQTAPNATYADMFADLSRMPGECIVCVEWHALPPETVVKDLRSRQNHFDFRKYTVTQSVGANQIDRTQDASAATTVQQFGDALKAVELEGYRFGECSLTVVLFDTNPRIVQDGVAHTQKTLLFQDGAFIEETYQSLWAWASIMPGNYAHNLRYLALTDVNVADMSLVFALNRGDRHPMVWFETAQQSLFGWNLHYYDSGNTLILGGIGSGKSFAVNYAITQAQQYNPFVIVFDVGHDYRKLTTLMNGSYLELGSRNTGVTLNPFAQPQTPEYLDFLHRFVKLLLENAGEPLTSEEDQDVQKAVVDVYYPNVPPQRRKLSTVAHLLASKALRERLRPWIGTGQFAYLFDHVEDTLTFSSLQVFELGAMKDHQDLLEPMLLYVLHRAKAHLGKRLCLFVMDEVWTLVKNATLRNYLEKMLRMGRKENVAVILATQMLTEFQDANLLGVVSMACPTKLLLSNKALDREFYAKHLQLSQTDLDFVTTVRAKGQFVLKRPEITKVLTLNVDPYSYWMYTNTPDDNAKLETVVEAYGLERGLEILAGQS